MRHTSQTCLVTQGGDAPLMYEKRAQSWQGRSWNEVANSVRRLASVLVDAGVSAGDRVMISAENRPEWAIADLAPWLMGVSARLCGFCKIE